MDARQQKDTLGQVGQVKFFEVRLSNTMVLLLYSDPQVELCYYFCTFEKNLSFKIQINFFNTKYSEL